MRLYVQQPEEGRARHDFHGSGSHHGIQRRRQDWRRDGSIYTLNRYENRLCNPNLSFWDNCDFLVIFKNGKVAETGVKEGRNLSPNMELLSLFQGPQ